jgi:hypothetical protein
MARKDSTSARLAEAFALVVPQTALAIVAVEDETIRHVYKWDEIDDDTAAIFYKKIFRLTPEPTDALLARAFAAAKLNPNDPIHWRALLEFFAWAHFGNRRRRGAPTRWDSIRYSQLLQDFNDVRSRNTHLSDEDVFRNLGKRAAYQTKRGPLSTNRLRKLFRAANDPKQNDLLGPLKKAEQGASAALKTGA